MRELACNSLAVDLLHLLVQGHLGKMACLVSLELFFLGIPLIEALLIRLCTLCARACKRLLDNLGAQCFQLLECWCQGGIAPAKERIALSSQRLSSNAPAS